MKSSTAPTADARLPIWAAASGLADPARLLPGASPSRPARAPQRPPWAARRMLDLVARMQAGSLALTLPDGSSRQHGLGAPHATLRVGDWQALAATLRSGDVGFAQAYIDGLWDTDSLPTLLGLALANRRVLEDAVYGGWWGGLLHRLRHLAHRNSRAGARRNIHAHYDLGNAFYALWLDPSMTYSSACFDGDAQRPLEAAQHAKYRRLLDALDLAPGARVLEIGCGWGGFATLAAQAGLDVTGLTLSVEQQRWANRRFADDGVDARARAVLRDYRDEQGRYDGVVSIEMFEAVGERYWGTYFAALARALPTGGRAAIQTITIDDALFERYRRGTDFIQQFVFPGGMLPSPSRFEALARASGFVVRDRFAFGADYARTLHLWHERFLASLDAVRAQGFDERFIRLWRFYLAYCEAAFAHGSTDVVQYTLVKA